MVIFVTGECNHWYHTSLSCADFHVLDRECMILRKAIATARKRASLYLAVKILLSLFMLVSAASTVTPTIYYAEHGGVIDVTGNLTSVDRGINKTMLTSAAVGVTCGQSGSNVTFATGAPRVAHTDLTLNDYIYTIQVNTTTSTPPISCFSVTFTLTPAGATPFSRVLRVATGSNVDSNQTIDCQFDIGPSLPAMPYSFNVAVQ